MIERRNYRALDQKAFIASMFAVLTVLVVSFGIVGIGPVYGLTDDNRALRRENQQRIKEIADLVKDTNTSRFENTRDACRETVERNKKTKRAGRDLPPQAQALTFALVDALAPIRPEGCVAYATQKVPEATR